VVDDGQMTGERLATLAGELLGDRPRLAAMAAASRSLGRPDATTRVVDEIEALLRGPRD
jgi:UDP-N-acetylglucosamine:LPS N-acetylglucosamine transferase